MNYRDGNGCPKWLPGTLFFLAIVNQIIIWIVQMDKSLYIRFKHVSIDSNQNKYYTHKNIKAGKWMLLCCTVG